MKHFLLIPLIFIALFVKAQNSDEQTRLCGTMQHLEMLKQQDPNYEAKMTALENFTQNWIANNPNYSPDAVITVPVVVHIVGSTASSAVSDARVQEQIDVLNRDYAGLNTYTMGAFNSSLKANTELQFCLAKRDPSGNSTTGIERRTTGTQTSYAYTDDDKLKHTAQGGLDQWDPDVYMNIWVTNLSGGLCGYAEFPVAGLSDTYGVAIHYQYFGVTGAVSPYNLGGTTTHEIGHCFNLYHIWGDDGTACSGTDYCTDTPNQAGSRSTCPGTPGAVVTDACTNTSPGIMYMNFMDYSYDACYANFTPNQKTRIQACFVAGGALNALASSNGCTPVGGAAPVAAFSADVTTSCTGTIQFTDNSTNTPTSWSWNFGDGQTSTLQNPSHTYSASGTYTVTLTATNSYGSDSEVKTNYITITLPTAPTVTPGSRCGTGTVTLGASGSGTLNWYDASTGGNLLGTGTSFTTPSISATTTYYVESSVGSSPVYGGKLDDSGTGSYTTGADNYEIFDAYVPFTILTVDVYAQTTGVRYIELRNSAGTRLDSAKVNCTVTGLNTVTVNLSVPAGTDHQLGLITATTANLYRNSAGVTYPYTTAGIFSITTSSYDNTRYYYFYNWQVQTFCTSSRVPCVATVNTALPASVSIASSQGTSICTGTSVTFTATPTNGGTTPTYQWRKNGTNIAGATNSTYTTTTLANNDQITCVMTSNATCVSGSPATSNILTMTIISSAVASISISATSGTTLCSGITLSMIATPVNGGTPTYQWKRNGSNINNATNSTYNTLTYANGDVFNCVMTSSLTCASGSPATSNSLTITVNPTYAVSIIISSSAGTSICSGASVTFSASATNGGTTPAYQWKKNGTNIAGATNSIYTTTTLVNNDQISCVLTSSYSCTTNSPATSNVITMQVSAGGAATVSIAANPGTSVCSGESVTFTATPVNGGTPVYQWKKNGANISGATNSTYTTNVIANNDVFTCQMTSSLACVTGSPATSNALTMTILSNLVPAISIHVTDSIICQGDYVQFTTTLVNGGSTPTYQWYLNGSPVSGATSSTIGGSNVPNGAAIYCVMTSSESCANPNSAISNTINMTVNPLPTTPTITQIGNTLYSSATSGNQWYNSVGPILGETSTSYTPDVSGLYYVIVIDGNGCLSSPSNTIYVDVTAVQSNGEVRFQILPNPNPGEFMLNIVYPGIEKINFSIYNTIGEKVFSAGYAMPVNERVLLNELPAGLYYGVFESSQMLRTEKIVINK